MKNPKIKDKFQLDPSRKEFHESIKSSGGSVKDDVVVKKRNMPVVGSRGMSLNMQQS